MIHGEKSNLKYSNVNVIFRYDNDDLIRGCMGNTVSPKLVGPKNQENLYQENLFFVVWVVSEEQY